VFAVLLGPEFKTSAPFTGNPDFDHSYSQSFTKNQTELLPTPVFLSNQSVYSLPMDRLPPSENALGQPIGFALPQWKPPARPSSEPMEGRFCRLEALQANLHATALHAANALDTEGRLWTYLPYGPFENLEAYQQWVEEVSPGDDPLFYAIVEKARGATTGVASYLRITPESGSIEVGHLCFSPLLQRTPAATEAMYLMMANAFTLGYRRYEWKCDALNGPSRAAALRLGFTFEGIFRQATVVKGRNRDTAWYSIIDSEWPALQKAYLGWLDPMNFDENGKQQARLSAFIAALTPQTGPIGRSLPR
jgi:RimJ/RimL family protein N-acetyltransferase